MRRFVLLILMTLLAVAPAMGLRLTGWRPDPVADALLFGVAVLAAGFMLSWGAEAAEKHISQGLIVALVALVTVLPEYAVDLYYAFRAGQAPQSNYVHYAAANMTGANRLLVGVAWPLMVLLHWLRTRNRAVELSPVNAVEIAFLTLGSLYAFVIVLKGAIAPFDFAVLFLIFGGYLYRVSQLPKADEDEDEDEEPGPAAALNSLRPAAQWAWMGGLTLIAFVVIAASAEPFAEAMVRSGRILGIDEFLLIQWLAPLASEAPAVTIAVLFVLAGRAVSGLTAMISDKINQWTLLVGMLPLAMSLGAGDLVSLPLDARQKEEFLLTAAQSLFAIMLLMRLRLSVLAAGLLFALFAVQVGLAFHFREDEAATINSLTTLAWIYLGLAAVLIPLNGRQLATILRDGLVRSHRRLESAQTARPRQPNSLVLRAAGDGAPSVYGGGDMPHRTLSGALTIGVLVADQATKHLARTHLAEPIAMGPFLNLHLGFNTGVTFGLFAGAGDLSRWMLVAATVAVALWLHAWMWRETHLAVAVPLALVVGGASGNILDRVGAGAVTDFIDAHVGSAHWPTFNLADSAIVIGVGWLILASSWRRRPTTSGSAPQ